MKSAAKVGLLVVVFVVLLVGAMGVLGNSLLGTPEDTYYAFVSDASGVSSGAQVLLAGVPVGEVKKVELSDPLHARLTFSVKKGTKLPIGSEVVLPSSLIGFGPTPVTIVPPAQLAGDAAPGSTLSGHKAGPLDSILPGGGKETMAELNKTMIAMRKLLEDQQLQGNVKDLLKATTATIKESQATLRNFAALAASGNSMLTQNRSSLNAMILSTRGTLEDVHAAAGELAKFAKSGKLQNGTSDLLAKANKIAEQASHLMASMDGLMNDPKLRANMTTITDNVAESSKRGPEIADNAKNISANMAVITERSKDLPLKIGEIADKASKLEDQLSGLVDKVGGFLGKKPSTGGLSNLTAEMDLMRQTKPGYWRNDFTATVPTAEGGVHFGIFDAFESNRLTVQMSHNVGAKLDYRYGVYASKPGMGVDYNLSSRFGLRTDVWDINNPRLDTRLRYEFGNGLVGWVGVDRLFHTNSPSFGIGIRK